MDQNKGMAILIAIAAAMLVIISCRACADDIRKTNNMHRKNSAPTTSEFPSFDYSNSPYDPNKATSEPVEPVTQEQVTEMLYEEVTNIIGEVIETIPITTPVQDVPADETIAQVTTTKSILDEYNEQFTTTTVIPPMPTDNPNRPKNTEPIIIELH